MRKLGYDIMDGMTARASKAVSVVTSEVNPRDASDIFTGPPSPDVLRGCCFVLTLSFWHSLISPSLPPTTEQMRDIILRTEEKLRYIISSNGSVREHSQLSIYGKDDIEAIYDSMGMRVLKVRMAVGTDFIWGSVSGLLRLFESLESIVMPHRTIEITLTIRGENIEKMMMDDMNPGWLSTLLVRMRLTRKEGESAIFANAEYNRLYTICSKLCRERDFKRIDRAILKSKERNSRRLARMTKKSSSKTIAL